MTLSLRSASHCLLAVPLAGSLLLSSAPVLAAPVVTCDSRADGSRWLKIDLERRAQVVGRVLGPGAYAVDVAARDVEFSPPGECPGVTSMTVLPGRAILAAPSRILIHHEGPDPRFRTDGRVITVDWPPVDRPGGFAVDCDLAADGVRTFRLITPGPVGIRGWEKSPDEFVMEVDSPHLEPIGAGVRDCEGVGYVRVLPGRHLRRPTTRLIVHHEWGKPQFDLVPGGARLRWLPPALRPPPIDRSVPPPPVHRAPAPVERPSPVVVPGRAIAASCASLGDVPAIRLVAPAGVSLTLREVGAGRHVIEVGAPDVGELRWTGPACEGVHSVRAIAGKDLGRAWSRLVVVHAYESARLDANGLLTFGTARRQGPIQVPLQPQPQRPSATGPATTRPAAPPQQAARPAAPPRLTVLAADCEIAPDGRRTFRLVAPGAGVQGKALSVTKYAMEIDTPDVEMLDLDPGACELLGGIATIPGRVVGMSTSKVIVSHPGGSPVFEETRGGARLTWAPESTTARSTPRPVRPTTAPAAAAEVPEVEPDERLTVARQAPQRVTSRDLGGMRRLGSPLEFVTLLACELREGPGRRYAGAGGLQSGERITVDAELGDWLRVGDRGWVFGGYVQLSSRARGSSERLHVVISATAPVHAGPGGQHEVVTELYRDQQVVVDEVQGAWSHVRRGGWVQTSHLRRR